MSLAHRVLLASVLIVTLLAGCAAPAAPSPTAAPAKPAAPAPTAATQGQAAPTAAAPASGEPYKIGGMFAITGAASSLGIPERDTALMLADEINKKGGINGHKIELIIADNRGDETESVKIAKKFIDEDKVVAIVGPSRSGDTLAIIDTVEKAGVPLISAAAAIQIVQPVRKWVFKTPQSDRLGIEEIIAFLKTKQITKVALLHESVAFGVGGREELDKQAPAAGISIVARESYGDKDPDMTAQLTKVKGTDAQAIIVWGTSQSSAVVAKNAAQLGIKLPLLMSHGIANKTFIDLAGPAANGVIFPAGKLLVADTLPDSDAQKPVLLAYAKAYKERYNKDADTFGGHAWDALQILFKALEKAGPDRAKLRDEIEKTTGFVGIGGIFKFSAEDHNGLGQGAFAMIEIKDGKWTAYK